MNEGLNIKSFNELIKNAFRDDIDHKKATIELLRMELSVAYGMKVTAMEEVVDDLNRGQPYHKDLETVNTIDSNCEYLGEELAKLGVKMDANETLRDAAQVWSSIDDTRSQGSM